MTLSAYQYKLLYKSGEANSEADCLSRLPVPENRGERSNEDDDASTFYSLRLSSFPVSGEEVARATAKDEVMSQVARYIVDGWPQHVEDRLKTFFTRRHELVHHQGCLLWGMRVIVPQSLRNRVMEELHDGHPGIVRMKEVARSYAWWPEIDADIERCVKLCDACQQQRGAPAPAPLHPWSWPTRPWHRLHLDFAGPFQGQNFLICVDSHSKWPEVFVMSTTTAEATIGKLRELFSRFGLPDVIVTDNGPQFIADQFETFLKENGVRHVKTAPYHPSSNGLAERFVRTLKDALRKDAKGQPLNLRLASFLLTYRNTPHATTLQSPAQLLLGRRLTTRLDRLKPSTELNVQKAQFRQLSAGGNRERQFQIGEAVYVKNFRRGENWLQGVIISRAGPVSYRVRVKTPGGTFIWRRHLDHLRECASTVSGMDDYELVLPCLGPPDRVSEMASDSEATEADVCVSAPTSVFQSLPPCQPQPRYPPRTRRAPNWHQDFEM